MTEKKELNNEDTNKVNGGGLLDQIRCTNRKCNKLFDGHENYFCESHGCTDAYYWKCPYCGTKIYR